MVLSWVFGMTKHKLLIGSLWPVHEGGHPKVGTESMRLGSTGDDHDDTMIHVPTPLATEPPMMKGRMWPGDAPALRAAGRETREERSGAWN